MSTVIDTNSTLKKTPVTMHDDTCIRRPNSLFQNCSCIRHNNRATLLLCVQSHMMNSRPEGLELGPVKVKGVICDDMRLIPSDGGYGAVAVFGEGTGLSGLLIQKVKRMYVKRPTYVFVNRKEPLDYTMHVDADATASIVYPGVRQLYDDIDDKVVKVKLPEECNVSEIARFDPIMCAVVDVVFPSVMVTETFITGIPATCVSHAPPWCERVSDFQVYNWACGTH